MSDHLLRLAMIVADLIEDNVERKVLLSQCEQIIHEREHAAPPAPERRTITREEYEKALWGLRENLTKAWPSSRIFDALLRALRLTVEDA